MFDILAGYYDWIRAAHIIFVIYWMAALLYMPRLFVYHHISKPGGEQEKSLILQEHRLLRIIMNPAMIVVFITGLLLLWTRWSPEGGNLWLVAKLGFVFILFGIHGMLSADRKKFEAGQRPRSEKFYRIINEVPAILTIFIVIFVVVEPFSGV